MEKNSVVKNKYEKHFDLILVRFFIVCTWESVNLYCYTKVLLFSTFINTELTLWSSLCVLIKRKFRHKVGGDEL